MNIFKNNTKNKTAKDYIIRKRNFNLFYDISNNSTANKLTCVKSNRITKFNNHSNLLNITHGYFDYYQNGKCGQDICNNFFSTEYNVEVFRNNQCNILENNNTTNEDVSHNYAGMILTDDKYPNNSIIDFSKNTITHYTNVEEIAVVNNDLNGNDFKYKSKKNKTKCFKVKTNDISI